ncbi:hypothetical protein Q3G72_029338 [Acer saccharum]|nr:hypothetical protein Q3G72_029338 [Acer saccharum]
MSLHSPYDGSDDIMISDSSGPPYGARLMQGQTRNRVMNVRLMLSLIQFPSLLFPVSKPPFLIIIIV